MGLEKKIQNNLSYTQYNLGLNDAKNWSKNAFDVFL